MSDASSFNTQLGLAYLKQGNTPRAKRKLFLALEQAPQSPEVSSALAYFFEKTGDLQQAESYYKKALKLAPNSGAQLNNYGTYLCRNGKYQQAEKYFLRSVADSHYVNSAGAYENAGLCAMAIPDYPKAANYFSKALEQDSSRKQSLYELVNSEIKQQQDKKALSYLQRFNALTQNDPTLLALATDVARKVGNAQLESEYRRQLRQLNNFSEDRSEA